ncbi:MAG: HEPN domain-containing protein [Nitrososphaeria archaeon]
MRDCHSEVLRRRALGLLNNARDNFQREEYDLVLFHVEQFLQLYLKRILYEKIGTYIKTHSLTSLLKELQKVYEDKALFELYNSNIETINLLEDAYITSRYLPREYDKEVAEKVLKFAEQTLEVLR